jgi:hypothetical protein
MSTEFPGAPEVLPISRRNFLGAAATAGAGAALGANITHAASPERDAGGGGSSSAQGTYYEGPDPKIGDRPVSADTSGIPKVGLRWAFSATVFFADRVMINSITSPTGRGYTSVGGGEIWGPRLQGRVLPHSGADYYKTTFSTYYMFEASDGALIFIHNRGTMRRFQSRPEPGQPLLPPTDPKSAGWTRFRATSVFTAPSGPHEWMNRTVFVGDAQRQSNPDHTVFTYYEVL